ncbi:MAG: DegV family protein [Defluviitaleaceae bacterium]|nr:DegV family protein [Defluviitaleaceae bacterium]
MTKIVVDSGCELPPELLNDPERTVEIAPLTLQLGDDVYLDDHKLDVEEYIRAMESYPGVVKTAALSPQSYLDRFAGKDSVFMVTLSSKLSGSYNSAMLAKQIYMEENKDRFAHVFDSLSTSVGIYQIAEKIRQLSLEKLANEEIVASVNEFMASLKTYFVLDKFDNLVKTGRVKPYIASIATMLSIKPVCLAKDGEVAMVDKARGAGKAIAKLVDIVCNEAIDTENKMLAISHVMAPEKAAKLKDEISKRVNFKEIVILECRGLCSTYAMRGGLILSFFGKPALG